MDVLARDAATYPAPFLRQKGTAKQLLVRGKPFIMLAGELHNSTASSLAYMEPLWDKMVDMGLNTVLAPLYWELTEPEEGQFDFTLLEGLIEGAWKRSLHLVPLWFGTWKNAKSCYAPEWVKKDIKRFFRAQRKVGDNTMTISPLCQEACDADARAYAAVMKEIRRLDEGHQTVIMMQVENEVGLLETSRDHSPKAEVAFYKEVPKELTDYLAAHKDSLYPEFQAIWAAAGSRASGTWTEVFGHNADEMFMAWHCARFVDQVAAAGKAAYDLPMYANAWLIHKNAPEAGQYPSGGPVPRTQDVWRAAAPHVDALAPDIYQPDFRGMCDAYARAGNPLIIPETRNDARCAASVFYALGQHNALCFAPFAIDSAKEPHALTDSYRVLSEIMPLLAERQGGGQMAGFYQQEDQEMWKINLGDYGILIKPTKPLQQGEVPGGGLIMALEPDMFLIVGRSLNIEFRSTAPTRPNTEFLWLDEGHFEAGKWLPGRRLNGDESGHGRWINLGADLATRMVKLHSYA